MHYIRRTHMTSFFNKEFILYKQTLSVLIPLILCSHLDFIVNPEIFSKDANESSDSRRKPMSKEQNLSPYPI